MKDLKLYIVEFGKPELGGMSFFGSRGPSPVFVMAKSYDEAEHKAMAYMASKPSDKKSVIDRDGSLNIPNGEDLMVKSVRLACDEIIW